MHVTGLIGMPRRVYAYSAGFGWDWLNLVSTVGAFMVAAGILIILVDFVRNLRPTLTDAAGNIWKAGTLDWMENHTYGARSVTHVDSLEPLWAHPNMADDVHRGRYYLPGTITGGRETIVTSAVEAEPQYLMRLPGPGWAHVLAAVFTAAFFLLLTVKAVTIALAGGALAVVMIVAWMWNSDPASASRADIGGGIALPIYVSGPVHPAWWAMCVLVAVAGALYLSYVFGYLYLWTVAPRTWPEASALPAASWIILAAALLVASGVALSAAQRILGRSRPAFAILVAIGVASLAAALVVDILSQWQSGLRPEASGHGAMVYAGAVLQAQVSAAVAVMAAFALMRLARGLLDAERRVVFDNLRLMWIYAVGQGLFGLLLTHGFPRAVG